MRDTAYDTMDGDMRKAKLGFTIVELLIVVVVIAILAAITIVAFNGIQQRSQASALQSSLSQAVKKIELYKVTNGAYPASLTLAEVRTDSGLGASYSVRSGASTYCLAYVKGATSYAATNSDPTPKIGGCAPSDGLVAEWTFNGNANDTSGNGMNGTVNGATLTTGQNGQANGAYAFSGSTQYISLASSTPLDMPSSNFSISTWVNVQTLPASSAWYDILSSVGFGDWSFGISAASNGLGYPRFTKVSQTDAPIGQVVTQNSWRHIVATLTYGPSPSTVEYYIDGVATGPLSWNHGAQGSFTSSTKRIGSRASSGYFKGSIDDLRVYNRVLSSAEVTSLYAAGAQ